MIYVECKPDELLVQTVSDLPRRSILHEHDKYQLAKRLTGLTNTQGLVDEDPGTNQPFYLERLQVADDLPVAGLRLLRDRQRNNHVVIMQPDLEGWILRACRDTRINMRNFGLPDTPNKLHEVINTDLRKFDRLLKELETNNSSHFRALRNLLRISNS